METSHIDLPDGRVLAVDARGPAAGPAVLFLHSTPGSRLLDPDPAGTAAAGVRLYTLDRPGYGASSSLPDGAVPTVAGFADDVAAALTALGVADVAAVGWSGGGRTAAALAARHPALVRSVALIGTPAPDDAVPWVPEEHRALLRGLRAEPGTATAVLAEIFAGYGQDPAGAVETVAGGPADDAVLADPGRRAALERMLAEAFRQGGAGIGADIVADQVVPWGFDPAAVGAPVTLWYGDTDVGVPPAHGRWWAQAVGQADLEVVAGAGHLLVLTAWPRVLSAS